jgi:hypothetical protein
MSYMQNKLDNQKDVRVNAISRIWGGAFGMLLICIPLTAITNTGPIIPIAVITGAALSTRSVWQSSERKNSNISLSPNQVESLEKRIADLEAIVSSDDLDLRLKIRQLESSEVRDCKMENS